MTSRILALFSLFPILFSAPFSKRVSTTSGDSSLAGARVLVSDDRGITLQFSAPTYQVENLSLNGQNFQKLVIPNAELSGDIGKPQLPVVSILLGVPAGAQFDLQVVQDDSRSLPLNISLPPVLESQAGASPFGPEIPTEALPETSSEIANSLTSDLRGTGLYPAAAVNISGDAWLRDQRIIRVEFHPFQIEPGGTSLRWHRSLQVAVSFDYPAGAKTPQLELQAGANPFEGALKASLLNYDQARSWRAAPQDAADPLPSSLLAGNAASGPRYKIVVDHDGLYRLTYADLANAGMPVNGVNPKSFHLTSQGEDVSIYVSGEGDSSFDPGDYIEFYGRKFHGERLAQLYAAENQNWLKNFIYYSDNSYVNWTPEFNATMLEKYTDNNAYWLSAGGTPGPRMESVSGASLDGAVVPTSYRRTVHAEQSHEWWTWHFTSEDTWFWDTIAPNISKPVVTNTYTTTLTAVAADGLAAKIHAEAVAYLYNNSYSDDHHTLFYLNDQPLEDATWDGHTRHTMDAQLPAGDLINGTNTLQFVAEKTQHMASDRIYFDWFSIEYSRKFLAEDNQISFSYDEAGTNTNYQIAGFSDPSVEVLDISNEFAPVRITDISVSPAGTLSFYAKHSAVTSYLLVGDSAIQTPKSISYDAPPDLLATDNAADYIIITHADFLSAAQTLADYRASQGMRTMVVDVQDLYDEFNFGIYNPIAIKNFLAYTFAHWQAAPAYVVLVGSGHWNFKDYTGGTNDYWSKPVYMPPNLSWVDPWQGETDSANLLAAVVGNDILPDLSIGRIPVDTVEQLNAVISKTIAYESSPYQDWQKRIMFVADNTDPYAGNFIQFSNAVIGDHVPLDYTPDRIYLDADMGCASPGLAGSCPQATYAITSTLNSVGDLFVNYVGHGSTSSWASEAILRTTADPVKQNDTRYNHLLTLDNGAHLPVVLSMTCLDGYWIHTLPDNVSLAVELLKAADKGAVATFSPTGLGVATGHDIINGAFYDAVFKNNVWRLGPATIASKLALYATGRNLDLINTFTIFGDPALHMENPGLKITPASAFQSGEPGTSVEYSLELANLGIFTDTVDVSVSGNHWIVNAPETVGPIPAGGNKDFLVSVNIPTEVPSYLPEQFDLIFTSRNDPTRSVRSHLTTYPNKYFLHFQLLPLIR